MLQGAFAGAFLPRPCQLPTLACNGRSVRNPLRVQRRSRSVMAPTQASKSSGEQSQPQSASPDPRFILTLATLGPLGIAQDAAAENGQPGIFGLSPIESLLLFAPVILYGIFSFYRSAVNPQAKLTDFLFIAAAAVIVLNIVSIIVFRVRIF